MVVMLTAAAEGTKRERVPNVEFNRPWKRAKHVTGSRLASDVRRMTREEWEAATRGAPVVCIDCDFEHLMHDRVRAG